MKNIVWKNIFGATLVMAAIAINYTAFAETTVANIESEQFRAVADAVITQHKLAEGESIRALINSKESSGGRVFIIQYLNQTGKCTQECVDVFTKQSDDGSLKTNVTFFRFPRQKCE